jgi:protein TonB
MAAVAGSGGTGRTLALPLVLSGVLHGALLAALLLVRAPSAAPLPPTYRVNLVAAPPGPRAVGVVQDRPADEAPAAKPAPPRPVLERPETPAAPSTKAPSKRPTRSTPTRATPTPATGAAARPRPGERLPTAGGGPEGGRGSDVANVHVEGIEFPYPGYLDNIVRQIALRFKPPRGSTLKAEVMFLIRRDGSISNLRFVRSSGSFAFDLEARGAVEAAAQARAFGPLPNGFPDDVLPVVFSFDPQLIR